MKKNIIFLFLFVLPKLYSQQINVLNMDKAVKIAHENRSILEALKYSTQASKYNEKVAISGYLPKLYLTSDEKFNTGIKGPKNNTTLQASQLIYSFGGPRQLKRAAKKGTEIAKLTERNQEDIIQYEVEIAFLQTWLLQEKKAVINSLNLSSKENIKKAEHQDELKLLGKNDWLKDASTYATNMSNVYLYIDELSNAQNQLEYLLGDVYSINKNNSKLIWNFKNPIKIKSLIYYYTKALKNRKEIKLKQKEAEQYAENSKYYKKNYLPEISLTGQISRSSLISSRYYYGNKNNSVGINLSWDLFDGASNYYESQKANANKLKALKEKSSYIKQVKNEVQKAYYELLKLKKQLIAKSVELRQAKNQFDLAKLKFKIGDISKVDFDTSKYNWQNNKFDWLTVKILTTMKQRELYFACGYPKII
ncbi:hypothetical protein GF385_01855 [Candidatus Dependentiae bacterium]|nr:hypothetical protein [Candidatus Dependentiae bacterium]